MKSLECLTKDCVKLLHNNNLLLPLIKSELVKTLIAPITIEKELKDQITNNIYNKFGLKNEDEFTEWLKVNNLKKQEIEKIAINNMKLKKYIQENFDHKVDSRFIERKNQLDSVVYSLIRLKDIHKAKEFYLRIVEKEAEFGELAKMYSEGIENKTRGIIGPCPLEKAHPILADQLRNSKSGKVQPPIEIDSSYIITRVESYEPARLDKAMREQMAEELFNLWAESQVNDICAAFLKKRLENQDSKEKII